MEQRRFYAERWKRRVRKRMTRWEVNDRTVGITAKSRKVCSNYCCGSRRRYLGRSIQEKRQLDSFNSQLDEL